MNHSLPFSAACERNQPFILKELKPYFSEISSVLEVGTGTAQHALYFAKSETHLTWQTADREDYINGIRAQLSFANLDNVLAPITLDVNQANWLSTYQKYQAVYTANTLHIMDWPSVESFFAGIPKVTQANALLFIYGPFKYAGEFTSNSNGEFDQTLRLRGVGSAIRDFEAVQECANSVGFQLVKDISMPANNQLLIWRKV